MSVLGRSWARGLVERLGEPGAPVDGGQLAGLTEEERRAIVRGERFPSKPGPSRWIADASGDGRACDGPRFAIEAVRVFERLKALGGSGSLRQVYEGFGGAPGGEWNVGLRGFVRDGIEDLKRLSLVSERADRFGGPDPVLVLAPGWEDLALSSSWSRADL